MPIPTHGAADGEAAIPGLHSTDVGGNLGNLSTNVACAFKECIHAYLRLDMHTHTFEYGPPETLGRSLRSLNSTFDW